jgi:hypothetical protein
MGTLLLEAEGPDLPMADRQVLKSLAVYGTLFGFSVGALALWHRAENDRLEAQADPVVSRQQQRNRATTFSTSLDGRSTIDEAGRRSERAMALAESRHHLQGRQLASACKFEWTSSVK